MNTPATGLAPGSSTLDEPRWHYRRSLASRVILMTTMAVCFSVALVALGAYVTVKMSMESSLDSSLTDRAHRAASNTTLVTLTHDQVPSWATGAADVRIFLVRADGEAITTDAAGPQVPLGRAEIAVASRDSRSSIRTVVWNGNDYRVVAVPYVESYALVLAQNMAPQERVLKRLGAVMLLFGIAGVIGAAAAGWAVARNGLRPVRRLTRNVERIARTEDLQPLPVEGDDEIARLATAFNDMLIGLSASRDRQRRLVADAGHELRTPLTSLRTNLDLLLQADASGDGLDAAARSELLDDVRGQIEEMSTLVGDLVELARDEPLAPVVEQVDLAEVVDRAVARARRRGTGLTFDVATEPWWVTGESASLERAVTNLLDNAVKWSPPEGTVRIRLNHGTLTVDDEGPGIAPGDREQVFERFYRSEESRSMPGSGLGLSIVRQVIERHSGNVRVDETERGGTRMVLQVPGAPLLAGT
jgi:two-component system sensor histidine kinase MprB